MQSSLFKRAKRFAKRINPFSRHGFHVSKIRHGRLDYFTHFLLHKHTGKITTGLLSVTTIALLLTSFSFANAAPTANPPTSNVSPNFNGVNIDSQQGSTDADYFRGIFSNDSNGYPTINVRTQKDSTNYSYLNLGTSSSILQLGQRIGNSISLLSFGGSGGTIFSAPSIAISTTSGALNLTGSTLELHSTSGVGTFDITSKRDLALTADDDVFIRSGNSASYSGNGDIGLTATNDININAGGDLTLSSNGVFELNSKAYFHQDLLTEGKIGFVSDAYLISDKLVHSSVNRTYSSQSGTRTNTCPTGSYVLACSYYLTGDTVGSTNVDYNINYDLRRCEYTYSFSQYSGAYTGFNSVNLCLTPTPVGL